MSDHHTERISVFIPEFIKVEIGLDSRAAAIAERFLTIAERDDAALRAKVAAALAKSEALKSKMGAGLPAIS